MLPDVFGIPPIAITGTGLRKSCEVRPQFQGAVVAELKESLAVNTEQLNSSADRNPTSDFGHGAKKRVQKHLTDYEKNDMVFKKALMVL